MSIESSFRPYIMASRCGDQAPRVSMTRSRSATLVTYLKGLSFACSTNRTLGTPDRYDFLNFSNIAIRREDFGQLEYYSTPVVCPERKMPTMRLLRYPNSESYIVLSWTASLDLSSPRAGVTYKCRVAEHFCPFPTGAIAKMQFT
jgi:hypothetical protein